MNNCFITFRSVTHAQWGQRLLEKEGIRVTMQRTPRWMEEKGCGYSLRVSALEINRATTILRRNAAPLRKVYAQRDDGKLEELAL